MKKSHAVLLTIGVLMLPLFAAVGQPHEQTVHAGLAFKFSSAETPHGSVADAIVTTSTTSSSLPARIAPKRPTRGNYTRSTVPAPQRPAPTEPAVTVPILPGGGNTAQASWYGPGFYGHGTACGQVLTTSLVGVAHKSLPCGTQVTFTYNGVTITVPVVDRGPYVAGRMWDLTYAACQKLNHCFTGSINWR